MPRARPAAGGVGTGARTGDRRLETWRGLVEARTFRSPRLWPARLWKRLAECFANALPWVRARGAHCKTAPCEADGEAMALPFVVGPWVGSGSRGRSPSRGEEAGRGVRAANNKGRGNDAAPLVRAIGFRLWLLSFSHHSLLSSLAEAVPYPRTLPQPCRISWSRQAQAAQVRTPYRPTPSGALSRLRGRWSPSRSGRCTRRVLS